MLIGLTLRTAGLRARGVVARLPASYASDGNCSLALMVGESDVGKPGYFLPTSVKSDRCGFVALGWGRAALREPMLKTGSLPP